MIIMLDGTGVSVYPHSHSGVHDHSLLLICNTKSAISMAPSPFTSAAVSLEPVSCRLPRRCSTRSWIDSSSLSVVMTPSLLGPAAVSTPSPLRAVHANVYSVKAVRPITVTVLSPPSAAPTLRSEPSLARRSRTSSAPA